MSEGNLAMLAILLELYAKTKDHAETAAENLPGHSRSSAIPSFESTGLHERIDVVWLP